MPASERGRLRLHGRVDAEDEAAQSGSHQFQRTSVK
jgi:hypothetical protein